VSATNDARLQVIALARATADDSLDPEAVDALVSGMDKDRVLVAAARLLPTCCRGLSYYMHCGVGDVLDEMTRRIVQAEQSGLIGFDFGEEGA
jgi:hypothetical protein